MSLVYDPDDEDVRRNPHELFARLRSEEPVHWSPKLSSWIVTDYELGTEVLTNFGIYSADRLTPFTKRVAPADRNMVEELIGWLSGWMIFRDPPEHARLRRQMAMTLNPKVFASLNDHVTSVVDFQLDGIEQGRDFDFVSAFAHPMPGFVVLDVLGVPRDRLLETKQYSNDLMLFIGGARNVDGKYERARNGAFSMAQLFRESLDRRRGQPAGDDVLGQLMSSDVGGRKMTEDELVGSMMMLLNAAHDTTANAISNALLLLASRPDIAQELRDNPARRATATEEFLRYDSPVLSVGRVVMKDTELGGKQIAEGNRVYVMLPAVNRDPAVFSNPDEIQLDRSPNPHMAFGKGQHFCLGAPLARLEVQVAISRILDRYRSIDILTPPEEVVFHNSLVARGPVRLDVRFN